MMRTANVIGSGPNGLAAAITLAERGVAVTVYERNASAGGACATGELTLPGFQHDLGSSVYPLGVVSPFFRSLPLQKHGLRWIQPPAALAHPLDDGSAAMLERSLDQTAQQFDAHDARNWHSLFSPTVRDWDAVVDGVTHPLLSVPQHPVQMANFGAAALLPAEFLARTCFKSPAARALFAGCAAHSVVPLSKLGSAAVALVLGTAGCTTGWPIVAGGAQSLTSALVAHLEALGGRVELGITVRSIEELPQADATFFDTSVESLLRLAGKALSPEYEARARRFKSGPGIFKVDWALREPIPWKNAACARAATVHLGGTLEEIAGSERDAFYGRHNARPFVLLVQPALFDTTRAPSGQHTAWAYCHVPTGSDVDMTEVIEAQVERFAPGFREVVLARRAWGSTSLAAWNANLATGDVSGGAMTLGQMVLRPTAKTYRTSNPRVFLCSASTPPGGGVHGMCGYLAATTALRTLHR